MNENTRNNANGHGGGTLAATSVEPVARSFTMTGLKHRYGKRPVLRGVDIHVQPSEIVGLLGPNGAGKTTCFHLASGLLRIQEGEISLDGEPIHNLPLYKRALLGLGYLPQEPSIFPTLSAEAHLKMVLEALGSPRKEHVGIIERQLEEFGLSDVAGNQAGLLSGGERRRLEIARAMLGAPKYLLLDEPFSGIDPIAVLEIRDVIVRLRERSAGILLTDHNVRETLKICDRSYILAEGRVQAHGSREEVVANETARRAYLGTDFSLDGN